MDLIAELPDNTRFREILQPTLSIFHPLLEEKRSEILDVPKKAFKYGKSDRHQLDIYYPPNNSPTKRAPLLFFIYGGGFTAGTRNMLPPFDLVYGCLGAFFARQGFITIIPDYRLAPTFQYPEPVKDVVDAMQWCLSEGADALVSGTTPTPDTDAIFMMGHSAGATYVATAIFHTAILPPTSDLRSRIKGVILMSGPYHYIPSSGEYKRFTAYWRTEERAMKESPLSVLFSSFKALPSATLPPFLLGEAEYEPEWLLKTGIDYQRLLEWHTGLPVKKLVAQGHNHLSLLLALSTGQGEEWALEVADWMRKMATIEGTISSFDGEERGILQDIDVMNSSPCRQCSQPRVASFDIQFGAGTNSVKTFMRCPDCGNKWIRDRYLRTNRLQDPATGSYRIQSRL